MKKIIINSNGDYRIQLRERPVKYVEFGRIFGKDESLSGIVNAAIVKDLKNAEEVPYVEPVLSFEAKKNMKLHILRDKRNSALSFGGHSVQVSDALRYIVLASETDESLDAKLSAKPIVKGDMVINQASQIRQLQEIYFDHMNDWDTRIDSCEKATTEAELDAISEE